MFQATKSMFKSVHQLRQISSCLTIIARMKSYQQTSQTTKIREKIKTPPEWSNLDPDGFGNVAQQNSQASTHLPLLSELNVRDDKDGYDKLEIKRGPKISLEGYYRMFNEHLRAKPINVREMMSLHGRFIYEDRYIPDRKLYTMLVSACASVGYTKKAVELFEEMKMFQLKPTQACVTVLFNACANCSAERKYGLEKIRYLREQCQLFGFEFNESQYNALIKAFARLGDQQAALEAMDEMMIKQRKISTETFAMLLMGAVGDRTTGMNSAVRLFQQLLASSAGPNVYVFNLLLRAVRDCGVGTEEQFLNICLPPPKKKDEATTKRIGDGDSNLPNLLTGDNLKSIVSINVDTLEHPQHRLALIGGMDSILQIMASHQVEPDLKTLTLLAEIIDPSQWERLFEIAKQYKIKLDTCFFNVLLKRAAKLHNVDLQNDYLERMVRMGVQPDIMTFGALTLGCVRVGRAARLLKDMDQAGIRVNEPILAALFITACSRKDFDYLRYLLLYVIRNQLSIPLKRIEQIDLLLKKTEDKIAMVQRRGLRDERITDEFIELHGKVLHMFDKIMKTQKVTAGLHPWMQFQDENGEKRKGKQEFKMVVNMMQKKMEIKRGKHIHAKMDFDKETED